MTGIGGFLGTFICLERVVGLNRTWTYAGTLAVTLGAKANGWMT